MLISDMGTKNRGGSVCEPPPLFFSSSLWITVCHGQAVGVSADISTASAYPTASACVLTVYHILNGNHEETLNRPIEKGPKTKSAGRTFLCILLNFT